MSVQRGSGLVQIELLGPIRAWRGSVELSLGPPKQRAVLGLLANRPNVVVGVEELIQAVWGDTAPRTAANSVHTYVAGLRRQFDPGRDRHDTDHVVATTGGGYTLSVEPDRIDVNRFTAHHGHARRLVVDGDPYGAIAAFEAALVLWRGDAYTNVPGPFAAAERIRLHEHRVSAAQEWSTAMLAVGRHAEVVAILSDAVAKEPMRERLRGLLMLALYRCGRAGDALELFRAAKRLFDEELGIEPGYELRELYRLIEMNHPSLDLPGRRPPDVPAPRRGRGERGSFSSASDRRGRGAGTSGPRRRSR